MTRWTPTEWRKLRHSASSRKTAAHKTTFAGYGLDAPIKPTLFPYCKCRHIKLAHHRGYGLCLDCEAQHKRCPFYREEKKR